MVRFRSRLAALAASVILAGIPARAADDAVASPVVAVTVQKDQPAQAASPASPAAAEVSQPSVSSKPAPPAKPETTLAIDIDLTRQRMTITESGKVAGSWPISSGHEGYRSPTGTYRPLWMSRMWYSKKYDNAPMPHAVFFSGGVAMHATQATGQLGQPASHGCIRQSPANAATTYRMVQKHGNAHTRIVVHGKPHDAEPRVARRYRGDQSPGGGYASLRPLSGSPALGTRRVILVDGDGNRHIAEIPANDPRLTAYQRGISAMAYQPRSY